MQGAQLGCGILQYMLCGGKAVGSHELFASVLHIQKFFPISGFSDLEPLFCCLCCVVRWDEA